MCFLFAEKELTVNFVQPVLVHHSFCAIMQQLSGYLVFSSVAPAPYQSPQPEALLAAYTVCDRALLRSCVAWHLVYEVSKRIALFHGAT